MKRFGSILALLLIIHFASEAQQKIKLVEGASSLKSGQKQAMKFNKFIRADDNQLYFIQKNTKIYCDTAILYRQTNTVEAIGNVLINDNDSIQITADSLVYDGNERTGRLRGDVVLSDDSVTLRTNYLDYYRLENTAHYFNDGSLEDGTNRLTSEKGYYRTDSKIMSFKGNVVLINPEYKLRTDTMVYYTQSKLASTYSRTYIESNNGNSAIAEAGTYNTTQMQSTLSIGKIETPDYYLEGDILFFDDLTKVYTAKKNVTLISKENDLIITGDFAKNDMNTNITRVYGDALMKKVIGEDTLFLSADTLVSIDDSIHVILGKITCNN
jgi:lipopolysaccharide assembly outer membrane protein LptD (OstA)